ncbi:MAG: hypothetical protein AB7K09_04550 [Planctomycetota bacterium]
MNPLVRAALVVVLLVLPGSLMISLRAQDNAAADNAAADNAPADNAAAAPARTYTDVDIEGWTVTVEHAVTADVEHWTAVRKEIGSQLFAVSRRVPAAALARLREIRIWVERSVPHCICACYHPNPAWLRDRGVDPHKVRCVEIGNTDHFIDWSLQQPAMLMHELAHGYHHRVLPDGFDNAKLREQYDRMVASGRYNEVLHVSGRMQRAYAMTDRMEYFAESSEAWLMTNDFYPFVRAELTAHDPDMAKLLAELWGQPGR